MNMKISNRAQTSRELESRRKKDEAETKAEGQVANTARSTLETMP